MNKTFQKMNGFFWMKGMQKWVNNQVRECIVCQQESTTSLTKARRAPLVAIPVVPKTFWRVHIDLCGPFRESRNGSTFAGVAICAFLKYVEIKGKPKTFCFNGWAVSGMKAKFFLFLFFVCF
jgi:hypothetical protein